MPDEIHECPFCGSTACDVECEGAWMHVACVACVACGARGPAVRDPKAAIEAWNTRPIEDALRAEIETMKEQALEWANEESDEAQEKNERLRTALAKCVSLIDAGDIIAREPSHWLPLVIDGIREALTNPEGA